MKLQINNDPHLLSKGAIYGRSDEKKKQTKQNRTSIRMSWKTLADDIFEFLFMMRNFFFQQFRTMKV